MNELRVRDHSQPCEHDNQTVPDYEGFRIGHWTDLGYWCPGGKEIVLRLVDSIGQHGTTLKIVSPRMWVEVVEE